VLRAFHSSSSDYHVTQADQGTIDSLGVRHLVRCVLRLAHRLLGEDVPDETEVPRAGSRAQRRAERQTRSTGQVVSLIQMKSRDART
jgi:hypothetical protein